MNVRDEFLSMGNFRVHDSKYIRFWEDIWLGKSTLKQQYRSLYNIARKKNATVVDIFSATLLILSFRRSLVAENLHSWHNLVLRIANIHLTEPPGVFRWSLKSDGQFSVSTMYQAILDSNIVPYNNYLGKIKIPLKKNIFVATV
jgi:hypothetical protein